MEGKGCAGNSSDITNGRRRKGKVFVLISADSTTGGVVEWKGCAIWEVPNRKVFAIISADSKVV